MAKNIRIQRAHPLGRERAIQRLTELGDEIHRRYGVRVDQHGDRATVDGKGVAGFVSVDEDNIHVDLSLGMPASLIAGKIEQGIHKAIDDHFSKA